MGVRTTEELLEIIKTRLGDDVGTDENISFLEDISDTINDLTEKASDSTNWKEKYETNDAEWRKKYTDRFFSNGINGENNHDLDIDEPEPEKPKTFDDLFKIGE